MDKGQININLVIILILLNMAQMVWAQEQSPVLPGATQASSSPVPPPGAPMSVQSSAPAPPTSVVLETAVPSSPSAPPLDAPSATPPSIPPSQPAAPPMGATVTGPLPPPSAPPPVLTPTTPAALPSPADVAQFQEWLKNNGQRPPMPMAGSTLIRPPSPPPVTKRRVPTKRKLIIQTGPDAPLVESPPLSYNEAQEIMLKSAPASPPPSPESAAAFDMMMQQNVPLSPQQVVRLRQLIDKSQRAAAISPTIPPKPVSSTIMVNLAPGATPPAIRLAQGYVSSLVFVDSTGAPWPIASYDIGDPKATNIQWDGKSNILVVQAITPYSDGNLVVRLVGLPTPVTLAIVSGQRVVDYRTDIHVSGIGPNSKEIPIGTPLPNSANQLLLSVLDGVAPPGSKQLMVKGSGDCQAWLLGDMMYLRTRFTLLSPGWIGKMVSPDGMIAYELQRTSSVLISQYGNPIELKIEGF